MNVNLIEMPHQERFSANPAMFPFPQTAKKNFQYLDAHSKKKGTALVSKVEIEPKTHQTSLTSSINMTTA